MGIAVLGPLTVNGNTDGITPRDRVVLAALAVSPGQYVTAEQLADALWSDRPPASWSKIVQGCVVRLRKQLGHSSIQTSPQGYRLVIGADDLDATRFVRLVSRGRELLTRGEPERAAYLLDEALALWRGRPLIDVDGWDAGRTEAGRLQEQHLEAEELRLEAALRAGRYRDILAEARARVEEAPLRERRWALLALAQYQAGRQGEALRTLRRVRTILAEELGLDPGPDLAALEQAILRQDPSLIAETALPEPSNSCPYLGLVPYDVGNEDVFFGRDADVATCRSRFAASGVLVVVGPSGSGKSSLVRAGVAAGLRRDGVRVVVITPGAHPMDALTQLPDHGPAPVLVVDQCEEVVSLCVDPDERAEFLDALVDHATHAEVVIALRADRIGELSTHRGFARMTERGLHLLSDMGPEELRAVIEGPALQTGLLLEPGLVDLLVREVEGEPGALPLLSHALRETWQRREGRTLTVAGYRYTGGIRGAVAQSAEQVYEQVPTQLQPVLRDLLLRLVAPSTEGDAVRSRVPRRVVAADPQHERLVEMLVSARLVTSDEGIVELAHEALARAWPRLRGWLNDDREGQRIMRHLAATAEAWDAMGRPVSELYGGLRLAQAREWRDRSEPALTSTEREFIESATLQADAELRTAQARAEQEASAGRRTRRLAAGLAGLLVLALLAAASAVRYQSAAEDRADDAAAATTRADANRLAAVSSTVGSLDLSMLLAVEAARMADSPETWDGLLTTLVEHRRATDVVPLGAPATDSALGNGGRTLFVSIGASIVAWPVGSDEPPRHVADWYFPKAVAASPTDDLVAVSGSWLDNGEARIYDASGRAVLRLKGDALGGWPLDIGFSPGGDRLIIAVANDAPGGGSQVDVRDVRISSGASRTLATSVVRSLDDVWVDASVSADGSSVVAWTAETDGRAGRLDLATGTRERLALESRPADSVSFVSLAAGAAQLWSDGAVTLYDRTGQATQVLAAHQGQVRDVVVSPDGGWAGTVGDGGAVVLWDVDAETGLWSQRESLAGHNGAVTAAEVDADGRTLLTASQDQTVIAWDTTSDTAFGTAYPGFGDRWIANRPQEVVAGELWVAPTRPTSRSGDGSDSPASDTVSVAATFFDPDTGRVVEEVTVGKTMEGALFGSSVAVSPDATMVAVTSGYATTVLDTRTRKILARIVVPPLDEEQSGELVWGAGWTPDGSRLLLAAEGSEFANDDGGLIVVDPATWMPVRRVDLGGAGQTMEADPSGRLIAVAESEGPAAGQGPGAVWLLDGTSLDPQRTLDLGDGDFAFDMSFSADGRWLAVAGALGVLYVYDTADWQLTQEPVKVHNQFVQQVEWMSDGETVATSGADGKVSLYDVGRGLVRGTQLPSSGSLDPPNNLQQGYTYLVPAPADDAIVALAGERAGHRYPLGTDEWLAAACAVAGRDLTRGEWARYLPDRTHHSTCGDVT